MCIIHVYILASTTLNHILKQTFTHPAYEPPTDLGHFKKMEHLIFQLPVPIPVAGYWIIRSRKRCSIMQDFLP